MQSPAMFLWLKRKWYWRKSTENCTWLNHRLSPKGLWCHLSLGVVSSFSFEVSVFCWNVRGFFWCTRTISLLGGRSLCCSAYDNILSLTGLELFLFGECVSFISALPNLEHVVIPGVGKSRFTVVSLRNRVCSCIITNSVLLILQP